MGLIYVNLELISGDDLVLHRRGYIDSTKIKRMTVKALVDTGAYMLLAINEQIKQQLDLPQVDEQVAELADGTRTKLEIVGPVEIKFANRSTTMRAMVLPGESEVLLGSIPRSDMDVLIDPKQQRLIVNPENPCIVKKPLK